MCGRARCTLGAQQVARACGIDPGDGAGAASPQSLQMDRYRPSYNVSPGAYLPVVRKERAAAGGDRPVVIHCMKWGLVPGFTNKSEKPDHFRMFNARSESIREKASFRRLLPANRCLVAVEGFYEWKKDGSKKQPYYIHFKDGRPLVFAALYDSWRNAEGETLYTFTILTTRCSSSLEWLHDRMPVILGNKFSIDVWVNDSMPKYDTVLVPYEDPDLVWYPVSPAMGKPSFDGTECIKEIQLKPAAENSISKFFLKTSNKGHSQLQFLSSSAEYPLKEEPGTDGGQELTKMEKHGNADVLQTLKEESSEDGQSFGSLREEPSLKDSEEFYRGMNIGCSGGLVPPKKETAETNVCNIKREFEEIESNTGLTGKSLLLTPQGKKSRNIKNSGDKQATILSYFGRR